MNTGVRDTSVERILSPDIAKLTPQIREIWRFRELLYFLVWRELKVRYRQTIIGIAWAVIQPLMMMVVFSLFFGRLARLPSDGIPYPVFYFSALVPWTYFAHAVNATTNSLVGNQNLVKKVYFPRLLLPCASVSSGLLDLSITVVILLVISVAYGTGLSVGLLVIPPLVLATMVTAFAAGVWTSSLNAIYRDIRFAIPMVLQLWLIVSPIAYPSSLVPERWRWLYDLNPMASIIEGFRWAVSGAGQPFGQSFAVSMGIVLVVMITGIRYFWRAETRVADIV